MDGLGPFSELKVFTATRGLREANELVRGEPDWVVINQQFVEEVTVPGNQTIQRQVAWVVMTNFGRPWRNGESQEAASEAAADAGDEALARANIQLTVPAGAAEDTDEAAAARVDVPPVVVQSPAPAPDAAPATTSRRRGPTSPPRRAMEPGQTTTA